MRTREINSKMVVADSVERYCYLRNHPLRHTPSILYPEICYDHGIWRNYIRDQYMRHLRPPPKIPFEDI